MKWLLQRFTEPTSIAGLSTMFGSAVAAFSGQMDPHNAAIIGTSALIGILLPEKKAAAA